MGTFRWLNRQGVESDDGYVLQRMHRFYYHYVEGGKTLEVAVELGGKFEEISSASFSKWQTPHDGEALSLDEQARIKANVQAALRFMNIRHRFV